MLNWILQAAASAEPLPVVSDYDEIATDYESGGAAIRVPGRKAADLVVTNQPGELFGWFSAELQVQIPLQLLTTRLTSLHDSASIGALLAERSFPMSPVLRLHDAEYVRGVDGLQTLFLLMNFNESDEITFIDFLDRPALPTDPAAGYESSTRWHLPFSGVWWVGAGGPTEFQNHHVVAPNQRHAYDLIIWNDGGSHVGDGTANEDHWVFGQPILAPAEGRVVTAVDRIPDNLPGETNTRRVLGNHVVIRTQNDEYLLLAHLQHGSLVVSVDDEVSAGDLLGSAGNSGQTTGPHLHLHAQDRPDIFDPQAIGLPLVFLHYEVNGELVLAGTPVQGEFIGVPAEPIPEPAELARHAMVILALAYIARRKGRTRTAI